MRQRADETRERWLKSLLEDLTGQGLDYLSDYLEVDEDRDVLVESMVERLVTDAAEDHGLSEEEEERLSAELTDRLNA